MASRWDPTGVSNTCPTIDKLIEAANEILDYAERPGYIITRHDFEMLKGIIGHIDSHAEEVREMNSNLREFGHDAHKRAEAAEKLAEEREAKIEELEAELRTHLADLECVEQELEDVKSELQKMTGYA